jgi:hypothetical protein
MADKPDLPPIIGYLAAVEGADQASKPARNPRKPSIGKLFAEAKKAGASSVTTPDGYIVKLGEVTQREGNELEDWMEKHAGSTERH